MLGWGSACRRTCSSRCRWSSRAPGRTACSRCSSRSRSTRRPWRGNVELRYRGGGGGSDFAWASLDYAEERRSLHIDPGAALRSGQTFEIVLRPGIMDQSGAPLAGARTLAWRVTGG